MVKKINEFKELQKKKGKKGFSMIELIIVLAIMAILVALIGTQLIPYLEKSREKRDKTTLDTCKTALESVMADHEYKPTSADNDTLSNVLAAIDTNAATEFEEYAGVAAADTGKFKSADALNGGDPAIGAVSVQFNDQGVITQMSINSVNLIE